MFGAFAGIARLVVLAKPAAWTYVVVPAATLALAALAVLPPLFIGRMIDALTRHDAPVVLQLLVWYLAVAATSGLFGLAQSYATAVFRETLTRGLRTGLLAKLDRVRFDVLSAWEPGELSNRATTDVESLSAQLQYSLFPLLLSICTLVAMVTAMLRVDPRLSAVAFIFTVLTVLPLRLLAPRAAALHQRQAESQDRFQTMLQEATTHQGIALMRQPNAGRRQEQRFRSACEQLCRLGVSQDLLGDAAGLAGSVISALAPCAIMGLGAYLVVHGSIGVGAIVTVVMYQGRVIGPFSAISSLQVAFATISVTVRRLLGVIDLPEEQGGSRQYRRGNIAIDRVRFLRGDRCVLHGATLHVAAGEHVALIGPSGSGKSTVAALLQRLYDPDSGSIAIDGVDLRHFALDSLRRSIGLAPQDPLILDMSLRENLLLAQPTAGDREIAEVIDQCELGEVVARLPEGLDGRPGSRGARLSGGERQRLSLARTLLANPDVLILDEALSGVDLEMERRILANVRRAYRGRILIAITHRLASVKDFDRILAIGDGAFCMEARAAS